MEAVEVTYSVTVQGDTPPFKWTVWCQVGDGPKSVPKIKMYELEKNTGHNSGGSSLKESYEEVRGTANSFDDAVNDAMDAAREVEAQRTWSLAKVEEVLFTTQRFKDVKVQQEEQSD